MLTPSRPRVHMLVRRYAVRSLLTHVLSVSTRGIGSTPLHLAAERGDVPIARELLRVGYDVNVADHQGLTPMKIGEFLCTTSKSTYWNSIVPICPVGAVRPPC